MGVPAQAFGDLEECGFAWPCPCVVEVGEAAGDTVPLAVGEGAGLGEVLAGVFDGAAVADWPGVVAPAEAVPPAGTVPPPAGALPPVPPDGVGAPGLELPPVTAWPPPCAAREADACGTAQ